MSREVRVTAGLSINANGGAFQWQSRPTAFTGDLDVVKGPVPGAFRVSTLGTIADLSELTQPGYYLVTNLDLDNYVEYGIYDPATDVFYPWGEILPGEKYVGRFSRNLLEEYTGTGTGTTPPGNHVMFKANGAAVNVLLEAFEGAPS